MNIFSSIGLCLVALLLTSACNSSSVGSYRKESSKIEYYEKPDSMSNMEYSCILGNEINCYNIGLCYLYGNNGCVQSNTKAKKYLNKACSLGYQDACISSSNYKNNVQGASLNKYDKQELEIQCISEAKNSNFDSAGASCKKACEENISSSCTILGWLYDMGNGVTKSNYFAKLTYEKACRLNDGIGCSYLAMFLMNGNDGEPNYNSIYTYSMKACDQNIAKGCGILGFLYEQGKGVSTDYYMARTYLKKACDLNDGDGCNLLGFLYAKGKGVTKNKSTARNYFEKSCDLNNGLGCNNLALAYMHLEGKNVQQNYYNAYRYFEKACTQNISTSCGALGILFLEGKGVNKSESAAIAYFNKACNLGDKEACQFRDTNSSKVSYRNEEPKIEYYVNSDSMSSIEYSCSLGNEINCYNIGLCYLYGKNGCVQSNTKAKNYLNKACSLGHKEACNINLKTISSSSKFSYEESCNKGNSSNCYTLGTYHEKGSNGYARNYIQAKTYYDKACTLKNSEGCHALGMLFVQGQGVNEDFNTAKFYFKKACDLGKEESCVFYNELK